MIPNNPRTPFRFVVATDWVRPGVVIAASSVLAARCGQHPGVELVIATPADPQAGDAERAGAIVTAMASQHPLGPVVVESFREAISKPHDAAVVSTGDIDHLIGQVGEFSARVAEVGLHLQHGTALTRPRNSGVPADLEAMLHGYANIDAVPDHLSTQLAFRAARPPYQGTYVGSNRMLVRTSWFGTLYCPADELTRTPRLLLDGHVDAARIMYIQSRVHEGSTAVHLGAGIGDETTFMAFRVGVQGHVVAVEADPGELEFLELNVALSRYENTVDILPAQADSRTGRAAMDPATGWYGPHLGNPWRHLQHQPTRLSPAAPTTVSTVDPAEILDQLGTVDLVVLGQPHRFGVLLERLIPAMTSGRVQAVLAGCSSTARPEDWARAAAAIREVSARGWGFLVVDENGAAREIPLEVVGQHGGYLNVALQRTDAA